MSSEAIQSGCPHCGGAPGSRGVPCKTCRAAEGLVRLVFSPSPVVLDVLIKRYREISPALLAQFLREWAERARRESEEMLKVAALLEAPCEDDAARVAEALMGGEMPLPTLEMRPSPHGEGWPPELVVRGLPPALCRRLVTEAALAEGPLHHGDAP